MLLPCAATILGQCILSSLELSVSSSTLILYLLPSYKSHTYILYILRVLGQNGSGQNGTDKMVWTKWYTDKMVLDKMVQTKLYGQNGTDKTLTIKSSINTLIPLPLTI